MLYIVVAALQVQGVLFVQLSTIDNVSRLRSFEIIICENHSSI